MVVAHPVTLPEITQPDDHAPQQLESRASKLDVICPELLEHLRPVRSFCPAGKLELIVVLRTFVTNTKPRAGRSATDLLIDMVGRESVLPDHRSSRVAGGHAHAASQTCCTWPGSDVPFPYRAFLLNIIKRNQGPRAGTGDGHSRGSRKWARFGLARC